MNNLKNEQLSDQRLVTAVLNGDRYAFGSIIKKTEGLVAQMTFKMISSPGDRKDIAQDVYLKAFKNLRETCALSGIFASVTGPLISLKPPGP